MASIFGRMVSGQQGDMGFPLASKMAKIAAFATFVEGIDKGKIPLSMKRFISWSNSWLSPDFRVEDTGKGIIAYDASGKRYHQESYKWFKPNLMVGSAFKVTFNGLTDKERNVLHKLTQILVDDLTKYASETVGRGEELQSFDANQSLTVGWKNTVGDMNATIKSSMLDRL